jgi:amino acid transporter
MEVDIQEPVAPAPQGGLKSNAVSAVGATVMGIATMGPIAGLAFLPQIVAAHSGAATPFVYVLAVAGALCIAYTISQFTRWVRSAGSFYAFNAKGLGPATGVFSGWILLLGYSLSFPINMLSFGPALAALLKAHAGIDLPWWSFSLAAIVLVVVLTIAGLGLSLRVDLTILVGEVIVFLILALTIVIKGGASGNTLHVFTPGAAGSHSGGLLFGLVFAFFTCQGFESAANVAEETRDPRRNIPRALIGAVLMTGILFIFVSYAITIGFGSSHADQFAADPLPMDTLAQRYLSGNYSTLVDLAVVFAAFSAAIASCNALTRVLFAMGRDRVLPTRLARLHPSRFTPYVAILVASGLCLIVTLGVGLPFGPYPEAYSYVGSIAGIPFLLLYGLVGISLFVFVMKHHRSEFHPVKHLVIPVLGLALAGIAIYGSYSPLPQGAFLWINFGALFYALAGVGFAMYLRRRRPALMRRLSQVAEVSDAPS